MKHFFFCSFRHQVYEACRGFQAVFGEARERALKALAFAKTLRKDLEVAAEFAISGSVENFVERLMESGHIRVQAAHFPNRQIFVPGLFSTTLILSAK